MRHLALIGCLLLAAAPAHALRCGNSVISEGDSTLRLKRFCGEPAQVEQREDRVAVERYDSSRQHYYTDYVVKPYEIWTYNFGPRRFINRIEVRDGVIKQITTGGYGY
ncbi:MAG: DUF2845 domain-containing protein [Chromatiaceae bacterium]|nr:DUF2845 domain-containing protein [Chromatiaceae bacterium]MCF7994728.1 DUF2845 domain-containing protein [Chromatiaceae bacterium]MCF8015763.1 DUF2845 domain-containing protein [Chromatiaceae bacterium]